MARTYLPKHHQVFPNIHLEVEGTYGANLARGTIYQTSPQEKKVRFPKPRSLPRKSACFNPPYETATETLTDEPQPSEMPAESNELHIGVHHINKIYTDDTGQLPIKARSGNQYIMVSYHSQSKSILVAPFLIPQGHTSPRCLQIHYATPEGQGPTCPSTDT